MQIIMDYKILTLENYNNKFASEYFGVISLAPPDPVLESELSKVFIIRDKAGIVEDFKAERITLIRYDHYEIPMILALTANGSMDIELYNQDKPIAYYLFKKTEK